MTRLARVAARNATAVGLYRYIASMEEAVASGGGDCVPPADGSGYPLYRGAPDRLADVRAGRPVNLPAHNLPEWARGEGAEPHWWDRVVVGPDDSLRLDIDDGSMWLEENGL